MALYPGRHAHAAFGYDTNGSGKMHVGAVVLSHWFEWMLQEAGQTLGLYPAQHRR